MKGLKEGNIDLKNLPNTKFSVADKRALYLME